MSGKEDIALLKNLAKKFKAFLFSKDALSFLFFLLLSTAFWLSNVANKIREANITVPIHYEALPPGFAIANRPVQEIRLTVRDEGLNLFSYNKRRLVPLNIDLSEAAATGGLVKLSSEQILSRLSYYLYPTTSVIGFSPDSIVVQCAQLDAVTLPVKPRLNIELARQYIMSDSVWVSPREVTVYGRSEVLARLQAVETVPVDLLQLRDSVDMQVALQPIDSVDLSVSEVQVRIGVEMFTEKRARVPVTFAHVPPGIAVRSFPAVVEVTYNIGLSHYGTPQDDVTVVLDYRDILANKQEKQPLHVISHSPRIFNVRVQPGEVEFVLEQQN